MSYTIINDLHLGLTRRTGATPESLKAYNTFQFDVFEAIVLAHPENELIILGDLFNGPDVGYDIVWQTYNLLGSLNKKIYLVKGNHDYNKDRTKASAFDLLGKLLRTVDNHQIITEPCSFNDHFAVVPHMPNQQLFDKAVADLAGMSKILLFHANYDNGFAVNSDHSLNLTPEQAGMFNLCIGAHEHNARSVGNVRMLGAQMPCNIQEAEVEKFYHTWDGFGEPVAHPAPRCAMYCEVDWRDLYEKLVGNIDFIRIVGTAEPEEAATVIQEVARFRETSSAFFVSNSVKIGELDMGAIEEVAEADLHTFNPKAELMLLLSEQNQEKMRRFLS